MRAPLPRPRWVREALGSASGRGVRVAVVDSGWDPSVRLPGLRLRPGVTFAAGEAPAPGDEDRSGHGTACISTLWRVAPGAEICPVRVFTDRLETSVTALHQAVLWAVRERFDVISLSLWTPLQEALVPLYTACEEARAAGSVVVAAAPRAEERAYPSVFENVLSVGVGAYDAPFEYGYRAGEAVECLAACGDRGAVTWLGGECIEVPGSSFAAPNVAGIVALLRERHPGAGLDEIRRLLERHALPWAPLPEAGP
jgi:subtilisin family serine protease